MRFLSRPSIDGKCGHELIIGETGDKSIFRSYSFEPIWFYNPQSSFPNDKMEPGFFLDIADNIGDNVSYVVLPVKYWNKIPIHRRPTSLVCSVVRSRLADSSNSPNCVVSPEGFKVYNMHGGDFLRQRIWKQILTQQ